MKVENCFEIYLFVYLFTEKKLDSQDDRFSVFKCFIRKEPRIRKARLLHLRVQWAIDVSEFTIKIHVLVGVDRFYAKFKRNKVLKMLFFIENRDNRFR